MAATATSPRPGVLNSGVENVVSLQGDIHHGGPHGVEARGADNGSYLLTRGHKSRAKTTQGHVSKRSKRSKAWEWVWILYIAVVAVAITAILSSKKVPLREREEFVIQDGETSAGEARKY